MKNIFFSNAKYNLIFYSIIIIVSISCSSGKDKAINHGEIRVTNRDLSQSLPYTELVDKVWTVQLETVKDNLFAMAFRVLSNGSKIFILDIKQQTVFIFDMNGRYVNKIKEQGKGPGQYLRIGDLQLSPDKKKIIIYGHEKFLYFSESGEYIESKTKREEINFHEHFFIDENVSALFTGKLRSKESSNYESELVIIRGNEIQQYFPNSAENELNVLAVGPYLFGNNSKYFFYRPFRNQIYQISKNGDVTPLLDIVIEGHEIPDEEFKSMYLSKFNEEYIKNSDFINIAGSIVCTNRHMIVPLYSNWKIIGNIWISLKSGDFHTAREVNIDEMDKKLSLFARATTGDTVITVQDDLEAKYLNKEQNLDSLMKNPTVTFYTIKDF
jgi:hypothetical protein